MTLTYLDAASLAFGRRPFTTDEFRSRIGSERPAKLLHELKARGLVERVGRGKYRLLAPDERPDNRAEDWGRIRNVLVHAPLRMAWSGPSAVEAWTNGRYRVSKSPFAREFFLAVSKDELTAWEDFLVAHGLPTNPKRHIGPRITLEPRETLRVAHVNGDPVIPRAEVVKIIRESPALYADAEELLAR